LTFQQTATAFLTALAVASLAPVASASTHRFSAARDVTVSFALPRSRTSGSLVRFARNGVAIVRANGGSLTLRSSNRDARRLAVPGHGAARVRVELSADHGRARLTVGRRTTTVTGRFVAEDTVAVSAARLRGLRIQTDGAAPSRAAAAPTTAASTATSSVAAPAAGAAPQATAAPPLPAASPLFAPTSVWNAPLADNAPLDPANGVLVKTLRDTVAQNISAGWGPWVSTTETSPLYVASPTQATVRVQLDPGSWKVGLQQTFEAVPIPANAKPASGPDAHMTVWQPSTDRLWEFFQMRKLSDGWHASFGGAMAHQSQSPGYFDTNSWPGLSQSWWGATATSLPVIAGTMMMSELKAGVIPHALAINVPYAKPKSYSLPAQRTDGASTDPNAIPEGARFRLDPNLDVDALNLPPMTKAMAKAAQRYGMIVRDQTAHAISFFAENPSQKQSVTNPYTGPGGFFGGPDPARVMQSFPWDRLQLVKMDLRTGS
jgi:hypothetical protein